MMIWAKGELVRTEHIPDAGGYLGEFDEEMAQRIFDQDIGSLPPEASWVTRPGQVAGTGEPTSRT